MFIKAVISLALGASALANVFITSPVGSTTFTAGQQATVSWQDDGTSPNLTSFGPALIGIYTGNADQQTLLQTISTNTDVSTTSSVNFTPDGTIGPDSNEYFVRFTSISLTDATNPQYPAEAFSAKFTMTGMTGTSSASGTMVTVATTSAAAATIGSTTSPSTASTSATATSTGAAGKIGVTGITCFVGAAASLLGAMLL
ncbi:hypothetical protein DFJ58DRAFT_796955 [Suillus subalutaceus]|uniref:uncharacterized protein n=1 Tax=Suillus subalutaceus TaxID=48586 RepID=UPI001B86CF9C|nr:uncharacterized protein DFJ58DRAFT_796955 [Suillus subalutaceus]KAG1847815.1 hypothetical protein DFJ58DRAFT_796955 [Suillus subalutaceus]